MPIYSYRCSSCGAEYEVKQKFNDPPLTECKKCKGSLKRIISPVGVIFKGSGFHITDYKNKSLPSTSPAVDKTKAKESKGGKTEAAAKSKEDVTPVATKE
jgi:putative FmdB family regulatory protein